MKRVGASSREAADLARRGDILGQVEVVHPRLRRGPRDAARQVKRQRVDRRCRSPPAGARRRRCRRRTPPSRTPRATRGATSRSATVTRRRAGPEALDSRWAMARPMWPVPRTRTLVAMGTLLATRTGLVSRLRAWDRQPRNRPPGGKRSRPSGCWSGSRKRAECRRLVTGSFVCSSTGPAEQGSQRRHQVLELVGELHVLAVVDRAVDDA